MYSFRQARVRQSELTRSSKHRLHQMQLEAFHMNLWFDQHPLDLADIIKTWVVFSKRCFKRSEGGVITSYQIALPCCPLLAFALRPNDRC